MVTHMAMKLALTPPARASLSVHRVQANLAYLRQALSKFTISRRIISSRLDKGEKGPPKVGSCSNSFALADI